MALAAPGDKRTRLCDKCFATVDVGAPYCPECGAPMDGSGINETSDAAIYPLLARANLLRMRAEYKQAEDVCLGILKRMPNNASSHTLLGDICAERGDLEQAVEWYELSLDITPDTKVRDKLSNVKQRIHERDAAATAEQIGLPAKQPKFVMPIIVAIVIMVGIGIAAFFAGQKTEARKIASGVVDVSSGGGGARIDPGTTGGAQEPTGSEDTTPTGHWRDDPFTRFLADQFEDGKRISDAWQDPRTQAVTVTINAVKDENLREMAGKIGGATLERVPNASVVSVRVVVDGKLALVADVERSNWVQANSDAWKTQHPDDPAATTDLLLSNEWPARDAVTPPATTGGEAPTGGTETPNGTTTGQTTESTTGQ